MIVPPNIADYYRQAVESAKKDIQDTPDDRVIGMDQEQWIDFLVQKWGMSEIEFDGSRQREMVEIIKEYRLRGYDIRTDRGPGTLVREPAVRLEVPVIPSDTLQLIWKHGLAPKTYSISHGYPPFGYEHNRGVFTHEVQPDPASVKGGLEFIERHVSSYNQSIREENVPFRRQIARLVEQQRARVQSKHKSLDDLATAVGIPLRKRADVSSVIPTAPRVRARIAPVLPPPSKPPTRPVLEADKFGAILDLLDNSGRQFERTPQAFQQLTEEGLRDIMLSSLNSASAAPHLIRGRGRIPEPPERRAESRPPRARDRAPGCRAARRPCGAR